MLDSKCFGHFVENMGLGNPVLLSTGTMGMHLGSLPQTFFTQYCAGHTHGFTHGNKVSDTGTGNGLLVTIGVDKHSTHRTQNTCTQLQGKLVIHDHRVNR